MLDAGHGSLGKLRAYRQPDELAAVVITHMHPDHCVDLIALRNFIYTRRLPSIPLHLPPTGVDCLRDLGAALSLGTDYFDSAFDLVPYEDGKMFSVGTMDFETARSRHNSDSHMVGIRAGGRRCVYTGDTAAFAGLVEFATACDLLLVEATDAPGSKPEPRWHLGPEEIASAIAAARPRTTVLTHYDADVIDETCTAIRSSEPALAVLIAAEGQFYEI
jgi:ribonuclease BN (tRNA processing enzyme)